MTRFLLTQSLLASWLRMYCTPDPDQAQKDFVRVLKRQPTRPNRSMLDGIQFENMVSACAAGVDPPEKHKWSGAVREMAGILAGAPFQIPAYADKEISGLRFLLYGRIDTLKAGTIYDIKFSRAYQPGHFLNSPQHPMCFELVPEAQAFEYLVFTGSDICREQYSPADTPPIDEAIKQFVAYLETAKLEDIYIKHWKAREN